MATTLSGDSLHPAGLADTQLLAVDCMEQVQQASKTRGEPSASA